MVVALKMTSQALISVFSVLFGDKLISMGHKTTSAAVIMNVMMAVMNFSGVGSAISRILAMSHWTENGWKIRAFPGLFTGPLLKKFSMRQVAVTGGCFVVTGLVLTSFANSIIHIIITYSIFVGLGMGLSTPSGFLAVKTYFVESRGRAVGLSTSGSNCGQMAMPHVVRLLLETYGFSGALLVLGGVAMHGPLGSLFFHPVEWHAERRPVANELTLLKGESDPGDEVRPRRPRRNASMASLASSEVGDMADVVPEDRRMRLRPTKEEDEEEHGDATELKPQPIWRRVVAFMDLDLLRNRVYLNVLLGTASMMTSTVNYSLLLPFYLQRHVGLSMTDTALCLTMMAAGDFVSRLTVPPITDRIKARARYTFFLGTCFMALTRSAIAMSTGMVPLCVWNALCGFSRGAAVVNNNLCVADVCPEEKLPAAVGLNMVCTGFMLLAVGPIIGYVRDETEDYSLCMHLLSLLLAIAMLSWLIEGVLHWCRRKR
ncbi:monocarboxylate transporter 12-B-like [Schistocerca piceifrons]|uniref:monocarboxylate transporter 12-B-like n=1 Tax=Schistocerca piceifrons TaxID=274613 RepID=UPI001F5F090A|nr:monocarboxylate transporter 12-B-like [Schistocerca piceifrons]